MQFIEATQAADEATVRSMLAADPGLRDGHVEGLLSLQGQSGQRSVDFLVAADGRGWQLARIREGVIERGLESTWIGDQEAFERFQSTRLSAPGPFAEALEAGLGPGPKSMMRLGNAMNAVIADSTIESVDHFCVRVARGKDGFEYLGSIVVFVGRDFELSDGDELISKLLRGSRRRPCRCRQIPAEDRRFWRRQQGVGSSRGRSRLRRAATT